MDDFLFFDCSSPFCFLLIEFLVPFPYLIKYYNVMFGSISLLLCFD